MPKLSRWRRIRVSLDADRSKAHIGELYSSCLAGAPESLKKINGALDETAGYLRAERRAPWTDFFYQLANRIAHLYFLRNNGVSAYLILINFLNDAEVDGPSTEAEWNAAYQVVGHVLGLPKRHELSAYMLHVFPHITQIPDLR
jgi:hypothetical protein